jgi:hypothetical protein
LFKEDFSVFAEILRYDFLCFEPQRRRSNFRKITKISKEYATEKVTADEVLPNISSFTDIDFDDI